LGYAKFSTDFQTHRKPSPAESYRSSGAGTIRNTEEGSPKGGTFLFVLDNQQELPAGCEGTA